MYEDDGTMLGGGEAGGAGPTRGLVPSVNILCVCGERTSMIHSNIGIGVANALGRLNSWVHHVLPSPPSPADKIIVRNAYTMCLPRGPPPRRPLP